MDAFLFAAMFTLHVGLPAAVIVVAIVFVMVRMQASLEVRKLAPLAKALHATIEPAHRHFGIPIPVAAFNAVVEGKPLRFLYRSNSKRRQAQFSLFVPVSPSTPGEFRVWRKSATDGFFRQPGISVDLTTGDAEFDRMWHLESDRPDFTRTVFANANNRDAVQLLGRLGFNQVQLQGLTPPGGSGSGTSPAGSGAQLSATIFNPDKGMLADAARVLDAATALRALGAGQHPLGAGLHALRVGLPLVAESATTPIETGPGMLTRSTVIIFPWLAVVPVLFGGEYILRTYTLTDWHELLAPAALLAAPAIALYVWRAIQILGGRSHRELFQCIVIAVLAFPPAIYVTLQYLNAHLDRSPETVRSVPVRKFETRMHKLKVVHYTVEVQSWREVRTVKTLRIDRRTFDILRTQGVARAQLQIITRSGRFDAEWIASLSVPETSRAPRMSTGETSTTRPAGQPDAPAPDALSSAPAPTEERQSRPPSYVERIMMSRGSRAAAIGTSIVVTEALGTDLRVLIARIGVSMSRDIGPSIEFLAVGISIQSRNAASGRNPVHFCAQYDQLHGTLSKDAPHAFWEDTAFRVPGAGVCTDGSCEMRLFIKSRAATGDIYVDYSETVPVPIDRNLIFSSSVYEPSDCGPLDSMTAVAPGG